MNGWHNDFCFTEIVNFDDDQFSANCCFSSEAVNRKIESASFFNYCVCLHRPFLKSAFHLKFKEIHAQTHSQRFFFAYFLLVQRKFRFYLNFFVFHLEGIRNKWNRQCNAKNTAEDGYASDKSADSCNRKHVAISDSCHRHDRPPEGTWNTVKSGIDDFVFNIKRNCRAENRENEVEHDKKADLPRRFQQTPTKSLQVLIVSRKAQDSDNADEADDPQDSEHFRFLFARLSRIIRLELINLKNHELDVERYYRKKIDDI